MRTALVIALCTARAAAQPADWAPHRDPFDPHVIARYEQLLAADPFDTRTLAKLARLFTGRHTAAELEGQLGDDRPAGLIARAELHRTHNDAAGALALYTRATALAPEGPFAARAWLAIAQLHRDRGELPDARAAYQQVLAAGPPPALAVSALRPLAELAAIDHEPAADTYYVQLLALAPDDSELWLARGSSLAAREPRLAAESFARAEELLVRDPARRLDAIARQGDALDRAHDPKAAQAEYWRAIGLAPKGYYLVGELVDRIVDVAARAKELPALRDQLLHAWPEAARGYLEWSTLGRLAKELGDRDTAIVELGRAARLAPWELSTQRTLTGLLVAAGRDPREQLRAAIRAAPSEPTLQLELAQRTWPNEAALDLLDHTARQFSRDASVVLAVAQQLSAWNQPARAERWYEVVARLEPEDDDHWLALAEAYFAAEDHRGAVAAWRRVSHARPGAMLRFAGALLDEHDPEQALRWIDASIAIDGLNPEAWRLRAEAGEQHGSLAQAIEDALREVSLTRPDRAAQRHARHHVVRLLEKTRPQPDASDDIPDGSYDVWDEYITRWRDALWAEHPDLDAGYLYLEAIASYHCTSDPVLALHCPEDLRTSVERLVRLAPDDPDLLRNAIRIYQEQGMYREAEAGLEKLVDLEPLAAKEIREEIGLVRTSIALRDEGERIYAGNGLMLDGNIATRPERPTSGDGIPLRAGIAIDYGATLRGSLGGSIGLGAFVQRSFGSTAGPSFSYLEARADWNQSVASDAGSLSAGLWRRLPAFSAASLALGVDERAEVRFGDPMSGTALATDVSAVFGLYEAPLDLGVRVEQWYAGSSATRALLEIRVRLF